jgi:heme-degrading monooxygenase HmoA
MHNHHLAQINIGRLIAPLDDPRIADFIAQLDPINKLADSSPGFVWRLQSEQGNATDLAYNDDPFVIVNMSVWESLEALQAFVYKSRHIGVLRERGKWFEKMTLPHYCLWWVPAGHRPTIAEGRNRLEHYQKHGSTAESFWFSDWYPVPSGELLPA